MKRTINIILGSIIIGVSYSMIFMPHSITCGGILGLSSLFFYEFNFNPAITVLLVNSVMLLLGVVAFDDNKINKYILPSILVPVTIFICELYPDLLNLGNVEEIVLVVVGSFLIGSGYSLIYKEGAKVGGFELAQDILNNMKTKKSRLFAYIIELFIILVGAPIIGFECTIYSFISVMIIHYLSSKAKIGISSSKTFFIITTHEKEVKNYLINDLKYDYTEFTSKGGYSNKKSKVIMTVIDTKDYYMLKEGISLIDSNAFISIIDNYESMNKNVTISKSKVK